MWFLPRPLEPRRKYCSTVVSTRAASLRVLPTWVRVINNVGSAALTNCRHISTLRGPQYKHDQEPHLARTVSPVSVLMNRCRSAQELGQNNSVSNSCCSANAACTSMGNG